MIDRMRNNRATLLAFWIPFVLFSFNTLAHEATCHDEVAGVCHSLHGAWTDAAVLQSVDSIELRPVGAWLTWAREPLEAPGFIKNIFHPPD
jgi:hypothetical protein